MKERVRLPFKPFLTWPGPNVRPQGIDSLLPRSLSQGTGGGQSRPSKLNAARRRLRLDPPKAHNHAHLFGG